MKKYQPSVRENNAIKAKILAEMKAISYKLEKGKYSAKFDKNDVETLKSNFNYSTDEVEGVIFTGSENLENVFNGVVKAISNFKKSLDGEFFNRAEESFDDLSYYLEGFMAISSGEVDEWDTETKDIDKKISWSRKRLNQRLEELNELRANFTLQEKRLEKDIIGYEKDLFELDDKMIKEDNERMMNELYRKISATKSKLDMLNVRRSNYSACFNVLDIIYANASEILEASEYSVEEMGKAKALLNIAKLKNVVTEPEKAVSILKVMEKDIKTISEKVKGMDEKVFGLSTSQTTVLDSALKYKEELLRKQREKEQNNDNLNDLSRGVAATIDTTKGEN